jgi:hypothetical protein
VFEFVCNELSKLRCRFREKTVNEWANRANFKSHPGKYTLIDIDYGSDQVRACCAH